MAQDRQINTFEKGLNKDTHPRRIQEGQYIDALNGRIDSLEGNAFQWQNINGTSPVFGLPGDEKLYIIGHTSIDNLLFVFYTNGSNRHGIALYIDKTIKEYVIKKEIVLGALAENNWIQITQADANVSNTTGILIPLVENPCFNFNLQHYMGDAKVEPQFDGSLSLYWTDDYNRPKRWNTNTDYYDCKQFDLFLSFKMPVIKSPLLDDFIINGGQLMSGAYRVAVRYVNADLNATDWSYLSPLIIITASQNKPVWWKYDGSPENENSGKSFNVDIFDVDTTYQYIQLGVIYYKKNVPVGYLTKRFPITQSDVQKRVRVDGLWAGDLDTNELGIDTVKYDKAKTLDIVNNKLFLGNLSNINQDSSLFEKIADSLTINVRLYDNNTIGEGVVVRPYCQKAETPDINGWGQYQNEWMVFNKTGYFGDNWYGFGIQFVLKDGKKTRVYPIGKWYQDNPFLLNQLKWENDFIYDNTVFTTIGADDYFDNQNTLFKIQPSPVTSISGDYKSNLNVKINIKKILADWTTVNAQDKIDIQSVISGYCFVRTDRFNEKTIAQGIITESFTGCEYPNYFLQDGSQLDPPPFPISDCGYCANPNSESPVLWNIYTGRDDTTYFNDFFAYFYNTDPGDIVPKPFRSYTGARAIQAPTFFLKKLKFFSPDIQYKSVSGTSTSRFKKIFNFDFAPFDSYFNISDGQLIQTQDWASVLTDDNGTGVGNFPFRGCTSDLIYNTFVFCHLFQHYQKTMQQFNPTYIDDLISFSQSGYFLQETKLYKAGVPIKGDNCDTGNPPTIDAGAAFNYCSRLFFARFCSVLDINVVNERAIEEYPQFYSLVESEVPPDLENRFYYVSRYVSINPLVDVDNGISSGSLTDIFEGDCYISNPHHRFMTKENKGDGKLFNNEPDSFSVSLACTPTADANPAFLVIFGIWVESTLNYNYRNTLINEIEEDSFYYPYSGRFDNLGWYASKDGYENPNHFPRDTAESLEYNLPDPNRNELQIQLPKAQGEKIISDLPTRIAYSKQKPNDSFTDFYREFEVGSYKDEELRLGEITRLIRFQNQILCVQRQSIVFLAVDTPIQTADPVSGLIKFGDPQVLPPRGVYVTQEYGSQHQWSMAGSTTAIYGFDARKSLLWRVAGTQFEKLSTVHNIDSLFQKYANNHPITALEDRPLYNGPRPEYNDVSSAQYAIVGTYDDLFDEYYLTLKSITSFTERTEGFTVIFGEQQNSFIGFYFGKPGSGQYYENQVNPDVYLTLGNRSFAYSPITLPVSTTNQNKIWELNVGDKGKFFFDPLNEAIYPTIISLVCNQYPDMVKVFDSMEFEAIVKDSNGNDIEILSPDQLSLAFKTSFQNNTPKPYVQGKSGVGNLRRVERAFQTFVPRDEVSVKPQPRLRDFYLTFDLFFSNNRNEQIFLDHIFIYFRRSQFKAGS